MRHCTRDLLLAAAATLLAGTPAWPQSPTPQPPPRLNPPAAEAEITRIAHCPGFFRLDFRDGKRLDVPEINLRLKVDTSPKGPPAGVAVKLRSGMIGDRASVVFASVADLKRLLTDGCGL